MRLFAGTVSAALVGGLCVFGATAQGLASAGQLCRQLCSARP